MIGKNTISLVREAGQSLVEFALVLLFIILPVTIGIADGAVLLYKYVVVTNGAREGARAGAIYRHPGSLPAVGDLDDVGVVDAGREEAIKEAVNGMIVPLVSISDPDGWQITYDPEDPHCVLPGGGGCLGYDVYRIGALLRVKITHHHSPFVGLVIGLQGTVDLSATAAMRIEPGGAAPASPP